MNILHITPAFYPAVKWGGPIYSIYELCNHIAELPDFSLRVLTTDAGVPADGMSSSAEHSVIKRLNGYEVCYCKHNFGNTFSVELIFRLIPLIREADVIHLSGVFSSPTIPTLLIAWLLNKPLMWSPRGAFHQWKGGRRRLVKKLWIYICTLVQPKGMIIHCTSEKEQIESKALFSDCRSVVIPNGIKPIDPTLLSIARPSSQTINIVYLGLISPVKGLDRLISAFENLSPNFVLNVYGIPAEGYSKYGNEVMLAASRSRAAEQIRFHGFVAGAEKLKVISCADVLVVPSYSENFSNVVLEALSCEVPVIVSRGAPWAEVEKIGCGLWVDNTPEELGKAIIKISSLDLKEMGRKGRAWVESEFGWGGIARRIQSAYEDLKNNSAAQPLAA